MTAHAAILQALFARERSTRGRGIRVSLFDSIADWMNVPFLQLLYGGHEAPRAGVNHATIAPYGAYACIDGSSVIFSVQNAREWDAFCAGFLCEPGLARDPRFQDNTARLANRAILDELVAAAFSRLTHEQAAQRLEAIGIAYGRLNGVREAAVHPHLRFVEIETPQGDIRIVAPAARSDADEPSLRPVPRLGQHTDRVRAEYSAQPVRSIQ
jgi:crotonobetainyl-CoA:carnitine CoA-transferase CaiB-like acyl-CoA transferase